MDWYALGNALSRATNRTIKLFRLKKKIMPVKVTGTFIEESLQNYALNYSHFKTNSEKNMVRYHLDSTYWTCTKKEFLKIVDYNNINERKYIGQRFDCDNFALSFKSQVSIDFGLNNVGLVIDYSGGHAYNIVIFSNGDVELFEPQNDSFPIKNSSSMYSFKGGIILL